MSKTIHGIDLTAADGVARLLDFHRATFGDAVMQADESGDESTSQQSAEGDKPEADEKLGEPGLKALQAERDARTKAEKDLADAKAALQRIEDDKLSEIERARKDKEEAEKTVSQLRLETARLTALATHPVPADYQDLVQGTDADSFMASAKKVAELAAAAAGGGRKPDAIPDSGSRTPGSDPYSKGGSVAAGREMFAASRKTSQKEG